MNQSRAAVFRGEESQIELSSFRTPAPDQGEILVRVLGSTLCGSDLHSFECRRKVPTPTILGHEIVGEIVSFGSHAPQKDISGAELCVGDRIVWAVVANCGTCFYCQRGLTQKCLRAVKYGHEALTIQRELLGGLAEHCLLVAGSAIVKLPDTMSLSLACPASCATATIAACLGTLSELRERTIVVIGAGMLGLTACAMAKSRGCRDVICVDVDESRLQMSTRFGATRTALPDQAANTVLQMSEGHGADAALELSGANSSFPLAMQSVRLGGIIVVAGSVFPGAPISVQLEQITRRNLSIHGVHNYAPQDLLTAVRFLNEYQNDYPFEELVAEWLPLEQIAEAFALAKNRKNIRIGVKP